MQQSVVGDGRYWLLYCTYVQIDLIVPTHAMLAMIEIAETDSIQCFIADDDCLLGSGC